MLELTLMEDGEVPSPVTPEITTSPEAEGVMLPGWIVVLPPSP